MTTPEIKTCERCDQPSDLGRRRHDHIEVCVENLRARAEKAEQTIRDMDTLEVSDPRLARTLIELQQTRQDADRLRKRVEVLGRVREAARPFGTAFGEGRPDWAEKGYPLLSGSGIPLTEQQYIDLRAALAAADTKPPQGEGE